jgi:hypothetical protein
LFVNVTREPSGAVTFAGETCPSAPIVIVAAIGPPVPPGFVGVVGELPPPPQAAIASATAAAHAPADQTAVPFIVPPRRTCARY